MVQARARSRKVGSRLGSYVAKRDFAATPEPAGKVAAKPAGKDGSHGLYVVQKHAASRLHYDFRLEHEGVLLSWAVPKQPSKNPETRRLAVQVEDHPLDYAGFEGVIPEGNYGAGKVEVWDRGRWEPEGDVGRALAVGRLNFRLTGGRLAGPWHLVRLAPRDAGEKRRGAKNWLLLRGRAGKVHAAPAAKRSRTPGPTRHRTRPVESPAQPERRSGDAASQFELATLVDAPPTGPGWLHETKWDGYRMLAAIDGGSATLWSRSGGDWSDRLPELTAALGALQVRSAVVDGEVVAVARGRSGFQPLQAALGASAGAAARRSLRFVAFDLLALDGEDLRPLPLVERKRRLAGLLRERPKGSRLLPSPHQVGRGAERFARACERGLEGIVSKRADSPYRPGRGRDWLKSKCRAREEFVIAGFTPARSASGARREEIGALALATRARRGGALAYAGRVGTGFNQSTRSTLLKRLLRLASAKVPVAEPPASARDVRWVRPELVAEVEFVEWTSDGRLRHPVFVGLREDKPAEEVRREVAAAPPARKAAKTPPGRASAEAPRARESAETPTARKSAKAKTASGRSKAPKTRSRRGVAADSEPSVAGIRITHPERPLFPESDLTKLDLASYFEAIWPRLAPHVVGRPLAFVRCPEGARAACFFQKHWPDGLAGVEPVDVSEPGEREPPHARIATLEGLVGLAQRGVIEIHLWGSRARALERPDRLVFDLDPGDGVSWGEVVAAGRLLRSLLAGLGLESFPMVTGGKGIHVVAPLAPRATWETVRALAQAIARALEAAAPERFVARAAKRDRGGRIFVDYLRNGRGATAIAPFSPRARGGATVAMPVSWQELARTRPDAFRVDDVARRLGRERNDPWDGYFDLEQSVSARTLARMESSLSAVMATGEGASHGGKKRSPKMAARKKSAKRYGEKAAEKVERAMHEMKRGKLRSGGSGKKVTSRKQAIAIGLSEAREAGGKVPPAPKRPSRKASRKSSRKK